MLRMGVLLYVLKKSVTNEYVCIFLSIEYVFFVIEY